MPRNPLGMANLRCGLTGGGGCLKESCETVTKAVGSLRMPAGEPVHQNGECLTLEGLQSGRLLAVSIWSLMLQDVLPSIICTQEVRMR